jgi:hypothetical protein
VKKIPKIGEDKYVIESRVVFEPEDEPGFLDSKKWFLDRTENMRT